MDDDEERTRDSEEDKEMMRSLASAGIVLLKNEGNLLPLPLPSSESKSATGKKMKKIAIIGPNAKAKVVSGGGSASLKASYFVTPFEGIVKALEGGGGKGGVEVVYHQGVQGGRFSPRRCQYDGERTLIHRH
jgi:beta-glucosidase